MVYIDKTGLGMFHEEKTLHICAAQTLMKFISLG